MIRKSDLKRQQKKLTSTYMRVNAMKMVFNNEDELEMYVGTKCGKLLIYRQF